MFRFQFHFLAKASLKESSRVNAFFRRKIFEKRFASFRWRFLSTGKIRVFGSQKPKLSRRIGCAGACLRGCGVAAVERNKNSSTAGWTKLKCGGNVNDLTATFGKNSEWLKYRHIRYRLHLYLLAALHRFLYDFPQAWIFYAPAIYISGATGRYYVWLATHNL